MNASDQGGPLWPDLAPPLGWFADMPEGPLAPYDAPLETTLEVARRMDDLSGPPGAGPSHAEGGVR